MTIPHAHLSEFDDVWVQQRAVVDDLPLDILVDLRSATPALGLGVRFLPRLTALVPHDQCMPTAISMVLGCPSVERDLPLPVADVSCPLVLQHPTAAQRAQLCSSRLAHLIATLNEFDGDQFACGPIPHELGHAEVPAADVFELQAKQSCRGVFSEAFGLSTADPAGKLAAEDHSWPC